MCDDIELKKCQEEQHLVQLEQDLQLVLQQDQQEQQEQEINKLYDYSVFGLSHFLDVG